MELINPVPLASVALASNDNCFEHKGGIYRILNTVNSKCYVGSAKNMKKRQQEHLNSLKRNAHHSSKLQRAWNKYGANAFKFEVLEYVENIEDLVEREQYWIDILCSAGRDKGYNIASIAGRPPLEMVHTPEVRAKIAATLKGRKRPPEVGAKISIAKKGCKRSPEVVENHRQKMKGRKPSPATIEAAKAARQKNIHIHESKKVTYAFISPEGVLYEGRGISEFALKYGLDGKALSHLNRGRIRSYKGWTQPGGQVGRITFALQSPDGSVYYGQNLKKFAEEHGIDYKGLHAVVRGRRKSAKGWTLYTGDEQLVDCQRALSKEGEEVEKPSHGVTFVLRYPDGTIHSGRNLRAFAREQNIRYSGLKAMVRGRIKSTSGWTLYKEDEGKEDEKPPVPPRIAFVLRSPNGSIHSGSSITAFAKEQNISSSNLWLVINGKRKSVNGWTLYKEDEEPPVPKMMCPRCQSSQTKKAGHHRGKQRYFCYPCGIQFTPAPKDTPAPEKALYPICPRCQSNQTRKNGRHRSGNQKYFCRSCNKDFTICKQADTSLSEPIAVLLSPDGCIQKVHNVSKFAKQHGIQPSNLHAVIRGRRKSTSGWTLYTENEQRPALNYYQLSLFLED